VASPQDIAHRYLLAGVDVLETVALVLKPPRHIEPHPTIVFAQILIARRTLMRVAGVAVEVGLADIVVISVFVLVGLMSVRHPVALRYICGS
jgi:hypothetical protein